jgi:hypothetical protein
MARVVASILPGGAAASVTAGVIGTAAVSILLAQYHVGTELASIRFGARPAWDAVAVLLIVLLTLVYGIVDALARAREGKTAAVTLAKLSELSNKILEDRRTLPAPEVLKGWTEATRAVHASSMLVIRGRGGASLDFEQCMDEITLVLGSLTAVVQLDDRATRSAVDGEPEYSANIMIHMRQEQLNGPAAERLQRNLAFCADGVQISKLKNGVLMLIPPWSYTTRPATGSAGNRDSKLLPLVLALPDRYAPGDGLHAIPGAPAAWCKEAMDVCPDVFQIGARLLKQGAGQKAQADAINAHFRDTAKHVRSFISLPLISITAAEESRRLGVVNVNCSTTGLLDDPRRQELLYPHLAALVQPLADILEVTSQRAAQKPPAIGPGDKKK